jgi:hypothetical protein
MSANLTLNVRFADMIGTTKRTAWLFDKKQP